MSAPEAIAQVFSKELRDSQRRLVALTGRKEDES